MSSSRVLDQDCTGRQQQQQVRSLSLSSKVRRTTQAPLAHDSLSLLLPIDTCEPASSSTCSHGFGTRISLMLYQRYFRYIKVIVHK